MVLTTTGDLVGLGVRTTADGLVSVCDRIKLCQVMTYGAMMSSLAADDGYFVQRRGRVLSMGVN